MREFIDKTLEQNGTPINRDYLMAIQGFDGITTSFDEVANSIIEQNSKGETKTTTFTEDGDIVETFAGERTITKITRFLENGEIVEELQ